MTVIHSTSKGLRLVCIIFACVLAGPGAASAAPDAAPVQGKVIVVPDPGDLSGVWISSRFNSDRDAQRGGPRASGAEQEAQDSAYRPPPLMPWARDVLDQQVPDAKEGHPYAYSKSRCLPAGTPQSMFPPAALPIQILVNPGQVTVLFEEFNQFRVIRMNARHLADPDPGYFGDSVGRWEGDTLVVDTIGINDRTTLGNVGAPHTEDLHVVERIHHIDKDTIEDQVEMTDPKTFTGVWKLRSTLKRATGMRMEEYFCDNDRNTPDATGKSGAALPGSN
jgi:hypothetical protein